jgi:glycosyltransferase involved in cell wall biosynthesis
MNAKRQAIHQFVAGFTGHDAISNEARVLRTVFQRWGHDSTIYANARHVPPELRHDAADACKAGSSIRPDDIVLLHLSVGTPVNDVFADLTCRKVILYHNVTPPEYFSGINPDLAGQLAWGRSQAAGLRDTADVVLADSRYNADELRALGYPSVSVFPLFLDLDGLTTDVDPGTLASYSDGDINVLFVGRCAPNKAIEDALKAFEFFQKEFEPRSRFIQVGSFAGTEAYRDLLRAQARENGVRDVELHGTLSQPTLNAIYASAHVFLCMSEHEGFCIPLLESMAHDVPVLAYAAAAVPETLDGAGVLVREKHFVAIAAMMHRLVHDSFFRAAVVAGQRKRLQRFSERRPEEELRTYMGPLLATPCERGE